MTECKVTGIIVSGDVCDLIKEYQKSILFLRGKVDSLQARNDRQFELIQKFTEEPFTIKKEE